MWLGDRPIVQWVWDATVASDVFTDVVVATPDAEIADTVAGFGGSVVLTSERHVTGTDRVAEVAAAHDHEVVANVQGDQPFVTADMLRALVAPFALDVAPPMSTLATAFSSPEEVADSNMVKVVTDRSGNALYFSRAPIPFAREGRKVAALHHIGLYGFQRAFLAEFAALDATPLELAEGLEQLRALEYGHRIRVAEVAEVSTIEINTPDDMVRAERYVRRGRPS